MLNGDFADGLSYDDLSLSFKKIVILRTLYCRSIYYRGFPDGYDKKG